MFMKEALNEKFLCFVLTYYSMENYACSLLGFSLKETTKKKNKKGRKMKGKYNFSLRMNFSSLREKKVKKTQGNTV